MDHSDSDNELDFSSMRDEEPETFFWGVNIPSNSTKEVEFSIGDNLEVTNAALATGTGSTVLYVIVHDEKFVLCTLSPQNSQYRIELSFGISEAPVKFGTTGPGTIALTGFRRAMSDDDEIDSDLEGDETEHVVEMEQEVVEKKANGKANGKALPEHPIAKKAEQPKPKVDQPKAEQPKKPEGSTESAQGEKKKKKEKTSCCNS